jgi:hypothetical protein
MDICASFALGTANDSTEATTATVGCRTYHAGVALNTTDAVAKADHCWHAGPSGGKQCGSPCTAYCALMMQSCNATANQPFADTAMCMAACSLYDPAGNESTVSGANLWCKIYHATASFGGDKSHCTHASPSGAGLCGTRCENYCMISAKTCTGNNSIYADFATCNTTCSTSIVTDGTVADRGGNTKDCRIYHAFAANATANPAVHCPHASHSGGDVCGTWCTVYCDLAMLCTGNLQLYTTPAACMSNCTSLKITGKVGDTSGDSIQCRIYHLGVAAQTPALATAHCPHGLPISAVCGGAPTPTSTPTPTGTGTGNAYTIIFSSLMLAGIILF